MIKASIKKNGVETNSAVFESQELAQAWVAQEESKQAFGKPAWTEYVGAVVDEQGNELEPAKEIQHPAEYVVEYSDITEIVAEQEKIQRRVAKQDVGAQVIAIATEINASKNYTPQQLQALLADTGLFAIERLAWSGSLDLLKQAILNYSGSFYDSADKAKLIKPIDDFFAV